MHVKDFRRTFLDEYVLYVCYDKITVMPLGWDFGETRCVMYYAKLEREYAWLKYKYVMDMLNVRSINGIDSSLILSWCILPWYWLGFDFSLVHL